MEDEFLREPVMVTVVPTDDPRVYVTLSEFPDGDIGIGSIELVKIDDPDGFGSA